MRPQQGRGVYQYPTAGQGIRLVGITASGEVAFELSVSENRFHPSMEERCWRWLDRMDPTLRLMSSSD